MHVQRAKLQNRAMELEHQLGKRSLTGTSTSRPVLPAKRLGIQSMPALIHQRSQVVDLRPIRCISD